jgi:hypothetical protein
VDNDNKENAKEQYFGTAWDLGKGCRIEKGIPKNNPTTICTTVNFLGLNAAQHK